MCECARGEDTNFPFFLEASPLFSLFLFFLPLLQAAVVAPAPSTDAKVGGGVPRGAAGAATTSTTAIEGVVDKPAALLFLHPTQRPLWPAALLHDASLVHTAPAGRAAQLATSPPSLSPCSGATVGAAAVGPAGSRCPRGMASKLSCEAGSIWEWASREIGVLARRETPLK